MGVWEVLGDRDVGVFDEAKGGWSGLNFIIDG